MLGHGGVEIADDLHSRDTPLLRVEARGVEHDAADPHRLQLHLGLPLVHFGQRLGRQGGEEAIGAKIDQPGLRSRNSFDPMPSEQGG